MELGISIHKIRKLIREGKIIGRKVPSGPYIILQKDNPVITEALKTLTK